MWIPFTVQPPTENHEKQHRAIFHSWREVMPVVRANYHHCGRIAITASQKAIPDRRSFA
jgi:hypothetical protein